jgi:hypothetical protein
MKIPSITEVGYSPPAVAKSNSIDQGDLRDFHSKHFASTPLQPEALTAIEGDDDTLGYYDDGVKRTLTDDQVAMFRHSETQAILREMRQERGSRTPLVESSITKDGNSLGLKDDVIERSRLLWVDASVARRRHKKKRKRAHENNWEERKKGSDSPRRDANDGWTPRRQARELDDNKDVIVKLDYGA